MPDPLEERDPEKAHPLTGAQKSAVTLQRHKDERRDDKLRHIRAQTADGTLTIRHMTPQQHDRAVEVASQTRTRNDSRPRRYAPPGE
jgi:prephenate dehydrogenase